MLGLVDLVGSGSSSVDGEQTDLVNEHDNDCDQDQSFSSCHSAPGDHDNHAECLDNQGQGNVSVVSCVPVHEVPHSNVSVISGLNGSNGDSDDMPYANLVESAGFSQEGNASQQGLFAGSSKCSMQFAAACVVAVAALAAVVGRRLGYLPELPPCPYPEGCG